jgi:hypothetical protein
LYSSAAGPVGSRGLARIPNFVAGEKKFKNFLLEKCVVTRDERIYAPAAIHFNRKSERDGEQRL